MKVRELIVELQGLDPEMTVTVPGYESGLDPIEGVAVTKVIEYPYGGGGGIFGRYDPEPNGEHIVAWLYGPHRHHSLPWENE